MNVPVVSAHLCAVLVFMLAAARSHAAIVSYRGLDKTHLAYNEPITSPQATQVKLEASVDGGSWQTLVTEPVSPPARFSNSYSHSVGFSCSVVDYAINVYSNTVLLQTLATDFAAIYTHCIEGTLLFDETVSASAASVLTVLVAVVVVPSNCTLTLNDGTYALYSAGGFHVVGTIVRSPSVESVSPLLINLYTPQHMVDQYNAEFYFHPGSDGSSIDGGSNIEVWVYASLSLKNCDLRGVDSYTNQCLLELDQCTLSGWWSYEGLECNALSSRFGSVTLLNGAETAFVCNNCVFEGTVTILRGGGVFVNCEFDSDCSMPGSVSTIFADSVFVGAANIQGTWTGSGPSPLFTDNSFVGQMALSATDPTAPFNVGAHYYGDPAGPLRSSGTFLGNRGAWVSSGTNLIFAPPKASGKYQENRRVRPRFWACGMVIGQNSIDHSRCLSDLTLVEGIPTLISIDFATTAEKVEGAKVFATIGNEVYWPTTGPNKPVTLYRDTSHFGVKRHRGASTVNIVLPTHGTTNEQIGVYLDTSDIVGYPAKSETSWCYTAIAQHIPRPQRPLRVYIVPVSIDAWGRQPGVPGDPKVFMEKVKQRLAAMFPISESDIDCFVQDPTYYSTCLNWMFERVLYSDISRFLRLERYYLDAMNPSLIPWQPDLVIAIVHYKNIEPNTHGLTTGVCAFDYATPVNIFVKQSVPEASLHEIGHAFGLYNGTEEYDLYKPNGIVMSSVTAFVASGNTSGRDFIQGGSVMHDISHVPFPSVNLGGSVWYYDVLDVMGNSPWHSWPLKSTYDVFRGWLTTSLTTGGPAKRAECRLGQPSPGWRRIFLWGATEPAGYILRRQFTRGTLRAADVTDYSAATLMPTNDTGASYYFLAYDAGDTLIHAQSFRTSTNSVNHLLGTNGCWSATFDFPSAATRYRIQDSGGETLFEVRASSSLTNALSVSASGVVTGDTVELAWTATASNTVPGWQPRQPLQHYVLKSTDNGTNWLPTSLFSDRMAATFPADGFAPGDAIAFRVVTSDGLRSCASDALDLRVANRAPQVTIVSPLPGACAASNTDIACACTAYDIEDGFLTSAVWLSSLDGPLGTGLFLEARSFSEGVHTVSCCAVDSLGLASTAHVAVTIGPMASIDLALDSNALSITRYGWNVPDTLPDALLTGVEHRATLSMRTTGCESSFSLQLYLQPPSGGEMLVSSDTFAAVPAFETVGISASFTPMEKGTNRFRGVIADTSPPDTDATNDQRSWIVSSVLPQALRADRSVVEFGTVQAGAQASAILTISNAGEQTLIMGSLLVTGGLASAFSLTNDGCSGAHIEPAAVRTVHILFSPTVDLAFASHLLVPSDDPLCPAGSMPIVGSGVPEPAWGVLAALFCLHCRRSARTTTFHPSA